MKRRARFDTWRSSDRWRLTDLWGEAIENTFSRRSKLINALLVAIVLGVMLSGFRAFELHQLTRDSANFSLEGNTLLIFRGTAENPPASIDRGSCEALVNRQGVNAAGILRSGESKTFPQLGSTVPQFSASASLVQELRDFDVVVGAQLTELPPGTAFPLAYGERTYSAVVGAPRPTGLSLNNAVTFALSPTVSSDPECLVILAPEQRPTQQAPLLAAQLIVSENQVSVTQLAGSSSHPYERFSQRLTRFMPLFVGVLTGVLYGLTVRFRSSELAAYRLSGTGQSSLRALLSNEANLLGGMMFAAGAAAATPVAVHFGFLLYTGLLFDQLVAAGSLMLTANLLTWRGASRSPMELAKDR